MNLRFVEAFYWVATLKSITRAAEKMSLTQSAMSNRISALEDELGVMLLDRRDRQFRLTIAGMRFLVHSQRLLELHREVKAEMGAGDEQSVPLRLGAIESVCRRWKWSSSAMPRLTSGRGTASRSWPGSTSSLSNAARSRTWRCSICSATPGWSRSGYTRCRRSRP